MKPNDTNIIEITNEEEFETHVIKSSATAVLVDFYATWCGPCKQLSPILGEIATEVEIQIVKLDIDQNIQIATKFEITSIPTMILFSRGKETSRRFGFNSKHDIIDWINKHAPLTN